MIDATVLAGAKLVQWLKYKLTGDDPRHWRLELHETGFRCFARKRCDEIIWSNLRSIRAFNREVLEKSLVFISLESKSGECVEIDERMKGFSAVIKRMGLEFPRIPADWYDTMKFPSLKAKGGILWQSECRD